MTGTPSPYRANGVTHGAHPHLRIQVGPLVVNMFDRTAFRSWTAAWTEAERLALQVWPDRDAFDEVARRDVAPIARTGRATQPRA